MAISLKQNIRGFTLIETLVVVSITAVVGLALSSAIQYFYRGNAYVLEEASAVESARRGLSYALTNIREASYGADGSYPVANAATSTVTFYGDVDGDGTVEKVRFYLVSGTLYRGIADPVGSPPTYAGQPEATSTVATYVKNAPSTAIFTYYDNTGAVLTDPVDTSQVNSVVVRIDVDLNPQRAPNIFTLSGTATLRNIVDKQ